MLEKNEDFFLEFSQGGYGSNNAYGGQQPQQQQSVGYGGGGSGYGSQGYTQSYQGYESYQQSDYAQASVNKFKTICISDIIL